MKAFPGLTADETADILLSTGNIPSDLKPLKPMEVAYLIEKMIDAGVLKSKLHEYLNVEKSHVNNYYNRMMKLIPEVQNLVDWGASNKAKLGWSSVWHYSRFGVNGQKILYKQHLKYGLIRDEVREAAQLFQRDFGTVQDCINEIISRRPKKTIYNVFAGKISNENSNSLYSMKQHKLDEILRECLIENYEVMNQQDINVSLSAKSYTIVFSENHKDIFKKFKNSNPDKIVNSYIKKYLNE